MDNEERLSRQQDIIPAGRLAECNITIVGVGAIGRQVACQLAAIGAPRLVLVDFDTVETSNLASQGYLEADLGRLKVEATAEHCRRISSGLDVQAINGRFRRSMDIGNAMFCCVDSITARQLIWQAAADRVEFFCDTRMSAEVLRVVTAGDGEGRLHYPQTLFEPQQAYRGSCTAKSTIYTASLAAALAVGQFTRWLRRLPVDRDLTLNVLTSELTCL